jgi:hypothetical protein
MALWAFGFIASKTVDLHRKNVSRMGIIEAEDEESANDKAREVAVTLCPPECGWFDHDYSVMDAGKPTEFKDSLKEIDFDEA